MRAKTRCLEGKSGEAVLRKQGKAANQKQIEKICPIKESEARGSKKGQKQHNKYLERKL